MLKLFKYSGGNTEEVLRELDVFKSFKIATKAFPFKPGMHSREKLPLQFKESLEALGTKSVDVFYLHAPDHSTPFEETLECVNELFLAGGFKEFGLSNYTAWNVMEIWQICKQRGFVLPTVYQVAKTDSLQGRYNVISRDIERELLPCLRKLNIRFYAYNPLCGMLPVLHRRSFSREIWYWL